MWIERGCVVEKVLSRDGRRLYQSFLFFAFLHVFIKHIFIGIWLKNNHILFRPPSIHTSLHSCQPVCSRLDRDRIVRRIFRLATGLRPSSNITTPHEPSPTNTPPSWVLPPLPHSALTQTTTTLLPISEPTISSSPAPQTSSPPKMLPLLSAWPVYCYAALTSAALTR
jgi:hypothetical protein